MTCQEDHRYLSALDDLPENQAGPWRHKCAGCAYQRGCDDGFDGREAHIDASALDESQAGAARHKHAWVAYWLGYYHGVRRRAQPQRP